MANNEVTRRVPPNSDIPDKLYFRIGDVAKLCEVPAYVLRFWESEFPQFKPNKGGTGQRLYRRKDVEIALRIKSLLYEEGYTIPGARQIFRQEQQAGGVPQLALAIQTAPVSPAKDLKQLRLLRSELQELHRLLSGSISPEKSGTIPIRAGRSARVSHGIALTPRNALSNMDDLFNTQASLLCEPNPLVRE